MCLICDIDGTLARVPADRLGAAARGDWNAYYACDFAHDAPTKAVPLVQAWLASGGIAVFVTSRRDTVRDETLAWLRAQLPSMNAANAHVEMRAADDLTPEAEWKVRAVMRVCPRRSAALVVEDNAEACRALARTGYAVLRVEEAGHGA